jgi:O-antigen ligase
MIAVAVVGTFSRSGFLCISLVLCLFMVRENTKAIVPAVTIGAIFLLLISSIPQLHSRIYSIGSEVGEGGGERYYLWNVALDMWLKSPLLGNGLTSFYSRYNSAAHNTYLQILAEGGIVGFGIFISIILQSIKAGYRLAKFNTSMERSFSYVLLVGLVGMSLMIGTITYQDIKLFWAECGVMVAMYTITVREKHIVINKSIDKEQY